MHIHTPLTEPTTPLPSNDITGPGPTPRRVLEGETEPFALVGVVYALELAEDRAAVVGEGEVGVIAVGEVSAVVVAHFLFRGVVV